MRYAASRVLAKVTDQIVHQRRLLVDGGCSGFVEVVWKRVGQRFALSLRMLVC